MKATGLPALADDSLSLPDGRQLRLEPLHLGDQYQVESANMESIFMLNLYENDALFQQLYFTTQENREEGPFIKAQDLNFDGYPDLDIIYQLKKNNIMLYFIRVIPADESSPVPCENQQIKWVELSGAFPENMLENDREFWEFLNSD